MLDLKPEYLASVKKILAELLPNMVVWAYGSRVTGQAHEASDLDLVVINPTNKDSPQENLATVREAFSQSNLPILVDVLDWAAIPEKFREEISKKFEKIQ